MARLMLSLDGQVLAEYNMNKERYTIGRLPDNDIRIDNPAVSGHHSLIINILNDSFLEDLNSTNGVYVRNRRVRRHVLHDGDVVVIGRHELMYVDERVQRTSVLNPGQTVTENAALTHGTSRVTTVRKITRSCSTLLCTRLCNSACGTASGFATRKIAVPSTRCSG